MLITEQHGAELRAILAAIKNTPIRVRRAIRVLLARPWADVRNTPDVDAYVLAWIASQAPERGGPRPHN
ncbi:MAG: hypothetical protein ACJ8F3_06080 [Xanthobacteraceae bacterium]